MSCSAASSSPGFSPKQPYTFFPPPQTATTPSTYYPHFQATSGGGFLPSNIPPHLSDIPEIYQSYQLPNVTGVVPKTALELATEKPLPLPNFDSPFITFQPIKLSWVEQNLQAIGNFPSTYQVDDLTNQPIRDYLHDLGKELKAYIPEHVEPYKKCLGHHVVQNKKIEGGRAREVLSAFDYEKPI